MKTFVVAFSPFFILGVLPLGFDFFVSSTSELDDKALPAAAFVPGFADTGFGFVIFPLACNTRDAFSVDNFPSSGVSAVISEGFAKMLLRGPSAKVTEKPGLALGADPE